MIILTFRLHEVLILQILMTWSARCQLYLCVVGGSIKGPIFYLTLVLLRLVQQHYRYNVTDQSRESEESYQPARIKEVNSKLHSFQASPCTFTATHLTLIYVCTCIRLSVPLGCLIKQAGIIIRTILNLRKPPGIEPLTSGLTSGINQQLYHLSHSATIKYIYVKCLSRFFYYNQCATGLL